MATLPLLPDSDGKPKLIGIARLASEGESIREGHKVEYFTLPSKSLLNRCVSNRAMPFTWTINPYRGCEFGCRYCYARYTHEYMELDGGDFESKIYVKQDAGALAESDLSSEKIWGEHIAIGTATDPYQPAEKEFGTTRAILEKMAEREGLSLSITTKSNQVVRDIDLLQRISERSSITIHMTVTTLRTRLARMLEPRIAVGVNAMPILPGLTDREDDLDALVRAARDAGAQWLAANVLFLMPSSWKPFIEFLEAKFPKLARRYRDFYRGYGDAPEEYRKRIKELVDSLRRKHGLGSRPVPPSPNSWRSPQMALALGRGE